MGHRAWDESRVDRAKVMLETNGDCNEDQGEAVGQEVEVVQRQNLVIKWGPIIEL